MLYKPNYCCHCGEKVERTEWFIWDSRKFCQSCEPEFKVQKLVPFAAVGFGILLSIFGLGFYLSSGTDNEQTAVAIKHKPMEIVRTNHNAAGQKTALHASGNIALPLPQQKLTVENQIKPISQTPKTQLAQSKSEPAKPVYFCGAETKKGTPCSRRVKGGGRCFQHEGQTAMLPAEKLLASQ